MIRTGDSITNPLTGETVTFRGTSADSNGVPNHPTRESRRAGGALHTLHPRRTLS
jgi:hypothetical protein